MAGPNPGWQTWTGTLARTGVPYRARPELPAREAGACEAEEQAPRRLNPASVCATLANAADKRTDTKPLDIYAAALEIGSVAPDPGSRRETGPFAETISHVSLASKVKMDWPEMHSGDRRTLEEGKFGLVHRFGQALRMLDERSSPPVIV